MLVNNRARDQSENNRHRNKKLDVPSAQFLLALSLYQYHPQNR